ncbi:MAG: MarR family winged helix-turn-helix transcriptional regulator [Pseudomonadota bacterium]
MKRKYARIHPFLHSATLLEKRLEQLFGPTGVRHRQALVLDALQEIGPSSQQHLAKHFNVSAGTMSSMISRLETLGYVSRETCPADRRTDVVDLTSSGRAAVEGVNDVWRQGDELVEKALGPDDAKLFHALTRRLSGALGGGPPKKESVE